MPSPLTGLEAEAVWSLWCHSMSQCDDKTKVHIDITCYSSKTEEKHFVLQAFKMIEFLQAFSNLEKNKTKKCMFEWF